METTVNAGIEFLNQLGKSVIPETQKNFYLVKDWEHKAELAETTKTESCFRFATLKTKHARQVAKLHIEGISTGFISSLGIDFVTSLYEAIIQNGTSFGFVTEDDKVLGFVAFSTNLGNLYKSIILRKGLRFSFILAQKMLSLQRVKKVFETLLYPSRTDKMNLPLAELLSIVVAPEARHIGLATQLVQKGLDRYQKKGVDKVKVLVAAANLPANKLYSKCGFELVGEINSHGILSNIYVVETAKADQASELEYSESTSLVTYPSKEIGELCEIGSFFGGGHLGMNFSQEEK